MRAGRAALAVDRSGAAVPRAPAMRPPPGRDALVRALARIKDARGRRALLARVPHLRDARLVGQLHEEALRLARVDLARAERLVHAARRVADRLDDRVARARSLRADGHIRSLRGRYHQALAHYRSALALLAAPSDALERAITLSGALQTLIYLGDYDRAHQWAREARAVFTELGDALRLARLEMNVGNVLYRQDHFGGALACYRRAHRSLVAVGGAQDVGIVLRNIAVCWISLGDFSAALDAYRDARTWCEQHEMPLLAAEADYNIAYLHYLRGEYARSIELYQAARQYCARVGDRYHQALCDLDQSEMYLELNLNAEGGQLAAQASAAFKALHIRYEMGKARVNMGVAAARGGDRDRALRLFEQARVLFRRERNRHWLTVTDVYRALVLSEAGDVQAARRLCESALVHFRAEGPPSKAALCEMMLGRLELRTGRAARAQVMVEDAIRHADRAEAAALAAQGYFVLGEIHEALANPEAAYAAFRQAHAGLETLRSHLAGEQLKIAFLEDKRAVYESLVALALQREPEILKNRVAFRYIEQAKSRGLADMMAFEPSPSTGRDHPVARHVTELRRELTWWQRKIEAQEAGAEREKAAPEARAMRQRARTCEVRLARAQAELDLADAEFGMLGNGSALPLETVRSAIPPDTVLVEYYEARGTILGCVLTRERLEIVPLASSARVRGLLRLLQFQISKFRFDRRYAAQFAPALLFATTCHLHDLYAALVAPLEPYLGARDLVIVPHRFLHYLPFHALFDGQRFLLDRFSISYAPSATVYYLCRTRTADSEPRSLVLGVPDPQAPQILDEIAAVGAALPAPQVFAGADATVDRLRVEGQRARYVHVATHGLFRQDNPMYSAVRLGDGEMSLLDLYQLRLSAELVALSGCGTGLSAIVGGDELVGLVRGLLYAGARAVLVTLWDVNDVSTATFMQSFYRHMSTDPHKGRATTAAMQELRAQYPHPYFWAPFALVGAPDGQPLYHGSHRAPLLTGVEDAEVTSWEDVRRR
jgi:tetratricopeptide (TPR) repeat protein